MALWYRPCILEEVRASFVDGLSGTLGIELTGLGDDWLAGSMPVVPRVHQPMGYLHGGASVALAETLGSVAGNLCVDFPQVRCMGQEINANHLRSVASGLVTGTARALHIGGRSQVWQVEIREASGALVCVSRLTLAVLAQR